MFDHGEYLFKFDLKSGYHHVDKGPEHNKFLDFHWDVDSVSFYAFKVLSFGLSSACYLFTKKTTVEVLMSTVYLDDGIVAVKGQVKATLESKRVEQDLKQAGFVVYIEKSVWEPSQKQEWLGFNIDLAAGELVAPTTDNWHAYGQFCVH